MKSMNGRFLSTNTVFFADNDVVDELLRIADVQVCNALKISVEFWFHNNRIKVGI